MNIVVASAALRPKDLSTSKKRMLIKTMDEIDELVAAEHERVKRRAVVLRGEVIECENDDVEGLAQVEFTSYLVEGGNDKKVKVAKQKVAKATPSKADGELDDLASIGCGFSPGAGVSGASLAINPFYIMWGHSQKTQLAGAPGP